MALHNSTVHAHDHSCFGSIIHVTQHLINSSSCIRLQGHGVMKGFPQFHHQLYPALALHTIQHKYEVSGDKHVWLYTHY